MPKVSVIITCYNYARYLSDAVESVVAQTYRDFEIIIVNDGSTDDTRYVALGLIQNYRGYKIRLAEQENSGAPSARNSGATLAGGEYLVQLDADDMLRQDFLEKLVPLLDGSPDLSFAYSWSELFGEETGVDPHKEFTLRNMLMHLGPHNTSLIRKSAWVMVGGHNTAMSKGFQDWEFYLSLFEAGCRGVMLPEPLHLYRKHGLSVSVDLSKLHSLKMMYTMRLLHPRIFEPSLSRISVRLAKAVIWLKSWTRDPLTRYIYVKFPRFHALLASVKYGRIK